jgi:hypothetical protein
MDLYLPADYLQLREQLDDWRDALSTRRDPESERDVVAAPAECVNAEWQSI